MSGVMFHFLDFGFYISGFRFQFSILRFQISELGLSWEIWAGGTKLGENFSLETSNQACFSQFFDVREA